MISLSRFYLKRYGSFCKSAFQYYRQNEKGYAVLEILVVISIMTVVFWGSAMIGRDFLAGTLAELESSRLIASLRAAQEYNRYSDYSRRDEFPIIAPKNATLLKVSIYDNFYDVKSSDGKFTLESYNLTNNIKYAKTKNFSKGIIFLPSGDMETFGTVTVVAKVAGKSAIRYVIIDRAGRVRLDKNAP